MLLEYPKPKYIPLRTYQGILFKDMDIVLRSSSALIQLELFLGYVHPTPFRVYSKVELGYDNVNCIVLENFESIDYQIIDDIKCTTASQTFNDMFSRLESPNSDEDWFSLVDGLAEYWFMHDLSYDGLVIDPSNLPKFNEIKDWAREAYEEDYS
jgi:hypothetical protein